MTPIRTFATLITALSLGAPALAQSVPLPLREGPRPQTSTAVPHVQRGIKPNAELTAELLTRVAAFPGVSLGPTRISLPGATGFQLSSDVALARPEVIVGGREFAHMHPDGSMHASLDPKMAKAAVKAGWAIPHPWSDQRAGWEGFVMIYTPTTRAELEVVMGLIEGSYSFVTGQALK